MYLRDHDEPVGVAGPHDVALVDLAKADPPADRCNDCRVPELHASAIDRRPIRFKQCLKLLYLRPLGVVDQVERVRGDRGARLADALQRLRGGVPGLASGDVGVEVPLVQELLRRPAPGVVEGERALPAEVELGRADPEGGDRDRARIALALDRPGPVSAVTCR